MDSVIPQSVIPQSRHDQLLADLRTLPRHQLMLKTLIPFGWTIPLLCDLVIDGFPPDIPPEVQSEIEWVVLRPEWVFARRVERSVERLDQALTQFSGTVNRLTLVMDSVIHQVYSNSPAGSSSSSPAATSEPPLEQSDPPAPSGKSKRAPRS